MVEDYGFIHEDVKLLENNLGESETPPMTFMTWLESRGEDLSLCDPLHPAFLSTTICYVFVYSYELLLFCLFEVCIVLVDLPPS